MDQKRYDVIIIGSGISGLTCAAYLARYKKKVLIIEQSNQAGGYFAGFKMKGFHFDSGIRAFESSGMVLPMLKELGLYEELKIEKSKVAFHFPDKRIEITGKDDIRAYYSWLKEKFPLEADGIDRIHGYSFQISDFLKSLNDLTKSVFRPSLKSIIMIPLTFYRFIVFLFKLVRVSFLFKTPLITILEKHLSDKNLINVISQKFFLGTPAYFGLGYIQLFPDYYYPSRGIGSVTDALRELVEENSGEFKFGKKAERIIIENNRAVGILLEGGLEIRAKAVVHAGDGKWLYEKMIPENMVAKRIRKQLDKAIPCESNVSVFIGTNMTTDELPFEDSSHIFYTPDYRGTTFSDRYDNPDYFKHVIQEISVPSIVSADLSPEGKCGIELSAVTVPEFQDFWKRAGGQSTEEYIKLKNNIAEQMIDNLERIIPGIRKRIEFIEVGTPYTNERMTMNAGGAITGWTLVKRNSFNWGTISKMFSFHKTSIKDLYHIGHWAFTPGGVPTCVLGATMVAKRLKKL